MEIFVSLIMIVFGILQIILFFKLWGMTNDVRRLTEHFCRVKTPVKQENKEEVQQIIDYDQRLDTVKPGDKVELIADGRELTVDSISNNKFFCKTGALSGYKYFKKSEVRYIEKG